jgi:predicted Fe-Mo cluster-binding NifX family protein
MKIAIATEGANVSGHFGKCENFTLVEVENSTVKSKNNLSTIGNQHGLLPAFLKSHDVDVVIAGGMGDGARQNLISNNIEIISGVSGNIEEVINAYLNGSLESNDAGCSDHGHSHEHHHGDGGCSCGHH